MDNHDEVEPAASRTWTEAYKMPIAAASGLLAVGFLLLLILGSAPLVWVGAVGLALVIIWVVVFVMLYRRGY